LTHQFSENALGMTLYVLFPGQQTTLR